MNNIAKLIITDNADTTCVNLPEEYLVKLKSMFKDVLEFFKENNIEYWIDGGTLLGCVREGGQIPYDDDIDLGLDTKNFFKFRKIMKELESKYGFEIKDQDDDVIKIIDNTNCYVRDTIEGTTPPRLATIDLFLYIEKKKQYMLSHPKNRELFKNCIYEKKDLFPLKEYDYGDIKVKGANNPDHYLTNYYGNWKEKVVYLYL